jgi:hypothetical protein
VPREICLVSSAQTDKRQEVGADGSQRSMTTLPSKSVLLIDAHVGSTFLSREGENAPVADRCE